jgi:predicted RecA/RadA family phage recombinase
MNAYVEPGLILNYTTGTPIAAGDVVKIGPIVGVVQRGVTAADIALGRRATVYVAGVVTMPKAAPLAISQGDAVYWDVADANVNKTLSGNTFCGHAFEDAASAATSGQVRLAYLT